MIPIVILSNDTVHLKRLIKTYSLTHTTQTIIDHIVTNRPERISESGTSDHDLIFYDQKD